VPLQLTDWLVALDASPRRLPFGHLAAALDRVLSALKTDRGSILQACGALACDQPTFEALSRTRGGESALQWRPRMPIV